MTARTQPVERPKPGQIDRHLYRSKNGYFARMAVPLAVRPIIGKQEFYATIHATTDAQAKRKLPAAVAQFHATIDRARAEAKVGLAQAASPSRGRSLTPRQLAVAHYSAQTQFDEELRNTDSRYAAHGFIDDRYVAALREIVSGAADDQGLLETLGWIIRKFQSNGNLSAKFGTPEWREAVRALAVGELESLARTAERDEGDDTGQPSHPLLTAKPTAATDPLLARILGPDSEKPLTEIVDAFIKERKPTDWRAEEYRLTPQLLAEVLGDDKPVYKITRTDVQTFKRALQDLPANRTKRFPGLTALEAIRENKARTTPFPLLSAKTINKYLGSLSTLLIWCVKNDVIPPGNPAEGISTEATSEGPERIDFSPGDLAKIFSAERFSKRRAFDETQWALLVSLFTGMRASETAQLKLDSIRHERGILVFMVEEKTKTKKRRLIPVHSALIALGINDRVSDLRTKGATHFLPDWYQRGEAKSDWSAFIPKTFNVTTKKNLGITGLKTWHSFRHCFTTGLTYAGVDDSIKRALCGHADHSAHAGYIHGHAVEAMQTAIEKLRFDGFALGKVT